MENEKVDTGLEYKSVDIRHGPRDPKLSPKLARLMKGWVDFDESPDEFQQHTNRKDGDK